MRLTSSDFRILTEKKIFQWKDLWRIIEAKVELPNGNIASWAYIKEVDYVVAVPVRSDGYIYMKKEYRLPRKEVILELPSGKVERGMEDALPDEVNRELQEEIGVKAERLDKLATFHPWNYANFRIHVYLARELQSSPAQPDEEEFIEVVCLTLDDALSEALKSESNAQTLIGLLLAKQFLDQEH